MTVKITLINDTQKLIKLDEWVTGGKLKGFCKTNKIKKYEVIQIEFINDEPNN